MTSTFWVLPAELIQVPLTKTHIYRVVDELYLLPAPRKWTPFINDPFVTNCNQNIDGVGVCQLLGPDQIPKKNYRLFTLISVIISIHMLVVYHQRFFLVTLQSFDQISVMRTSLCLLVLRDGPTKFDSEWTAGHFYRFTQLKFAQFFLWKVIMLLNSV